MTEQVAVHMAQDLAMEVPGTAHNKPYASDVQSSMSAPPKTEGLEDNLQNGPFPAGAMAIYMPTTEFTSLPDIPAEAVQAYSTLLSAHEAALQQLAVLQFVGSSGHTLTNAILVKFAFLSHENEQLASHMRESRDMVRVLETEVIQAKDDVASKDAALSDMHALIAAQEDELEKLSKLLQDRESSSSVKRDATRSSSHRHRRSRDDGRDKFVEEPGENGTDAKSKHTERARSERSGSRERDKRSRKSDGHRHHSRRTSSRIEAKQEGDGADLQLEGSLESVNAMVKDEQESRRKSHAHGEGRNGDRRRKSRSSSRTRSSGRHRSRSRSPVRRSFRYDVPIDSVVPDEAFNEPPVPTQSSPKGRVNPLLRPPPKTIQISGAAPPAIDTPKPSRSTLMGRLGLPINTANGASPQGGIGIMGRAAGRGRGTGAT